jgi:hypothetical protein
MTTDELARIFKDRYQKAPKGRVVTTIHLFGIEFASALAGKSIKEICARADVPVSSHTEIHKGIRLAEYVSLKS